MRENKATCTMEVPGQNDAVLFSQMLQMFPNIPHNIIQVVALQYANDAEMCARTLELLSTQYKEAEHNVHNPKSSATKQIKDFENGSASHDSTHGVKEESNLNILRNGPQQLQLNLSGENNNENECVNHPEKLINYFVNKSDSAQCSGIKNQNLSSTEFDESQFAFHQNEDSNNEGNKKNSVYLSSVLQGPLPNALHINIDNDEESVHSWRPNLSLNVLSSDFFLAQPLSNSKSDFEKPILYQSDHEQCNILKPVELKLDSVTKPPYFESISNNFLLPSYYYPSQNENIFQMDIESHLRSQKVLMNSIKYEVIKAKMELNNLNEEIENMTHELQMLLESKNTLGIDKLSEENMQLRLECQCLCMEVDYYLKGNGRLGEVDEKLYQNRSVLLNKPECTNLVQNGINDNENQTDINDKSKKWGCTACTFENHPEINSCEMCHSPRIRLHNPAFLSAMPSTCYCHPKEESMSR